jgi:hypothetical protein
MTHTTQYLKKYPLPWTFIQTDRDGGGALCDANGQIMVRLCTDLDWAETDLEGADNPKHRPVFNGESDDSEEFDSEERLWLVKFLLDRINGCTDTDLSMEAFPGEVSFLRVE